MQGVVREPAGKDGCILPFAALHHKLQQSQLVAGYIRDAVHWAQIYGLTEILSVISPLSFDSCPAVLFFLQLQQCCDTRDFAFHGLWHGQHAFHFSSNQAVVEALL